MPRDADKRVPQNRCLVVARGRERGLLVRLAGDAASKGHANRIVHDRHLRRRAGSGWRRARLFAAQCRAWAVLTTRVRLFGCQADYLRGSRDTQTLPPLRVSAQQATIIIPASTTNSLFPWSKDIRPWPADALFSRSIRSRTAPSWSPALSVTPAWLLHAAENPIDVPVSSRRELPPPHAHVPLPPAFACTTTPPQGSPTAADSYVWQQWLSLPRLRFLQSCRAVASLWPISKMPPIPQCAPQLSEESANAPMPASSAM